MIYFSNVDPNKPHMAFIGRWTPLHKGHTGIIDKKRKSNPDVPVLILIRDTDYDHFSAKVRAEQIKIWMKENSISGTVMIIPDIEGVYWGRKAGYKLEQVQVSKEIEEISATNIRKAIGKGKLDWMKAVASVETAKMVHDVTSKILDRGLVVWMTGCPCAGKTSINEALAKKVRKAFPYLKIQILDGDVMRKTPIAEGIGFSPEDRALHIRRMGQLSKMFADHGIFVIASFISPDRKIRESIKKDIGKERFVEVYIKASKKTRIERDNKGLYAKAIEGKIPSMTGYNAPYDVPAKPEFVCNTEKTLAGENASKLFDHIFSKV